MTEKTVLVTGTSRGIGRGIALRLAQDGWSVAIHYARAEAEAHSLAEQLGKASAGVFRADLAEAGGADALFEAVTASFPVDALVNNAGIYVPQRFLVESDADFASNLQQTFQVNLYSAVTLMRRFGKQFAERGGGKIVNVASRAGLRGENGAAIYGASKGALVNFSRSLAMELAPQNVGVFCLTPGWVDTSMARDGMGERLSEIISTIPMGRMATPEDCAAATAFLLRDEAAYLSGITLDVNGASYFH